MSEAGPDPMTEKIFGLIAAAEDQQKAVNTAIGGLLTEREALRRLQLELQAKIDEAGRVATGFVETMKRAAPYVAQHVGEAAKETIESTLRGAAEVTVIASSAAAKPVLESIAASARDAKAQQGRLEQAQVRLEQRWIWIAIGTGCSVVAAAVIIAYGLAWIEEDKVSDLRKQSAQLQAQINAQQEQLDQGRKAAAARKSKP